MPDDDVTEAIQLDEEVEALVDPTVSELWRTMHGYTPEAMAAAAAKRAGGGGSLPAGGTTGEVLTKASDADGDADWEAPTGSGSSLVDLGTVDLVDLLGGPQTLYTPDDEYVVITYSLASVVAADAQELKVVQDTQLTSDPRSLLRLAGANVFGPTAGSSQGYVSSVPVVAGLVTAVSGYFLDEALGSWQANHAYGDKECILGPDDHIWSSDPGTSGGTIPDFAGNEGGTVTDGSVVWTDEGAIPTTGSLHVYANVIPA